MKSKQKVSRKIKQSRRKARRAPEAGEDERLTRSGASPGNYITLQHQYGNRAVQRLLAQRQQANVIQLQDEAKRITLGKSKVLDELLSGAKDINNYYAHGGMCYDAVAYIRYLQGHIEYDQLNTIRGVGWIPIFKTEAAKMWTRGADIPRGSAVGFKYLELPGQPNSEGFFHAAVSVGGTTIRGINSLLSPGWTAPNDFAASLTDTEKPGIFMVQNQKIGVVYWSP